MASAAGATAADVGRLKPLFDRVLIKVAEAKAASQGGVLLPGARAAGTSSVLPPTLPLALTSHAPAMLAAESAKEKPLVGTVVAVGPGKKDEPMKLAVGDKVVYFKYAGDKMSVRATARPRC